jgi:hypothetical protein
MLLSHVKAKLFLCLTKHYAMKTFSKNIKIIFLGSKVRPIRRADNLTAISEPLDRRLTWHKHIFTKRKQLGLTLTKMNWLLGRQSKLSTTNKLLYKTILKPIWTYGIQLWGTASTSNIDILERFQSKALFLIHSSAGISKSHQSKKKSAATAPTMVLASAHILIT